MMCCQYVTAGEGGSDASILRTIPACIPDWLADTNDTGSFFHLPVFGIYYFF